MKKLSITAAMMASLALTATALALNYNDEPPLPITGIEYDSAAKEVTLDWYDYSDIIGFKLYTTDDLGTDPIVWTAMDSAQTKVTSLHQDLAGHHIYAFTNTAMTVDGSVSDKRFYRLLAVRGAGHAEVIPEITGGGTVTNYFIEVVSGDPAYGTIYVKTDGKGRPDYPITYWINVPQNPTQVWPDGEGGWTETEPGCPCGAKDPCACATKVIEYQDKYYTIYTTNNVGTIIYIEVGENGEPVFPPKFWEICEPPVPVWPLPG